jgi:N-acetyl-gamma-glutamyl-phosphate reductase
MYNMQLFYIGVLMEKIIDIGIIGGSGYTGMELLKILGRHKYSNICFITSRSREGKKISELYPAFKGEKYSGLMFTAGPDTAGHADMDVLFLCLPPHRSMEYVEKIGRLQKTMIIDIGSDFRIKDPGDYEKWYGTRHMLPEMLKDFTYGLPEINSEEIKKSRHIANPGCYPTSILLGLAPLLNSSFKVDSIIIDSKSGVSGAGRKLKEMYLFGSLEGNFYAYSPTGHRHIGEMEQEIEKLAGYRPQLDFTPHLLPVSRGIFSTIYCRIRHDSRKDLQDSLENLYEKYYSSSRFVRYMGKNIPGMKDTVGTNLCMIGTAYDSRTGTLKIFSTLDNLVKGAAGQAVQNMNLALGLEEQEGLELNGISN